MTTLYNNIFAMPMQMYWTIYLLQIYCVWYKIFHITNILSATNKYIVFDIKYFILQIYCLRQTRWISQKPISKNYYCVLQIYWTIYLWYTIFHIVNKSQIKQYICNIRYVYCKYIRQYVMQSSKMSWNSQILI